MIVHRPDSKCFIERKGRYCLDSYEFERSVSPPITVFHANHGQK